MKRLRLVQLPVPPPAALAATGNVPLAAGCLAVAADVHGLSSRLQLDVVPPEVTDSAGDAQLADLLARDEPELLGFSLYLWNVERSLHLAREVKRRSPRTTVLVGGPEVSADNPFLLGQEGFDIAVTGEAEETFAAVMHRLLDGGDVAGLPNVAVRTRAGLSAFGPPAAAAFGLSRYPSPYVAGRVRVDPERSTYLETVRGCRSSCTFCFYPKSSASLRSLDVEQSVRLVRELKERGARELVFLDPTFNHRPGFEPLLDALAEVNADRSFTCFAEVRAEGLTLEQAKKLKRAGFDRLELGLQSVNRQTLRRVKRGGSPEKVAEAVKLLHGEGISLLVDLIAGLPGDTRDDLSRGVDFLEEHGLASEAQVFALSLLPGTAMRSTAAQDGVEFDGAPPYRVRRTATLTEGELAQVLHEAEARLGRRLDEAPRPHLVAPGGADVTRVGDAVAPAARHTALWHGGPGLFERRAELLRAIDARLQLDPYCTLDVVLEASGDFPLDLIEQARARLDRGPASYLSRHLQWRGENLQRRVTVVVPEGARLALGWLDAARELAPVFVEQRASVALESAAPLARIVGEVTEAQLGSLEATADADAVCFADRALERRWSTRALG